VKEFSWSEQYRRRKEIAARFGWIFALPIERRIREVLFSQIADGASVLEVGAGDRSMGATLSAKLPKLRYESLDIDPQGHHEYRDFAEVSGQYDCVFALEVVEHLPLAEISPWLARLGEILKPGGTLVLSTPNTFFPMAYLRDVTHQTPLCYDELGALVEGAGLRVERIVRIYHDPVHRKLLRRYLFGWLFRMISIDFARQIVLVARKPTE
jgi:SAM-dependent methyltransferase